MARITLLCFGSRGDIVPYVALGRGLTAAGHAVTVTSFPSFEGVVRAQGLTFRSATDPLADVRTSEHWSAWMESGANPIRYAAGFARVVRAGGERLAAMFDDCWSACQGSDLIVYDTSAVAGPHVAERLAVPGIAAHLQPSRPTRQFPCFLAPRRLQLGSRYNLATYSIAEHLFKLILGRALATWQSRTLGMRCGSPPISGPFSESSSVTLFGFSRGVVPRPPDWHERAHVTGYWFLERDPGWQPPRDLTRFLESGSPPVYVALRSIFGEDVRGQAEALRMMPSSNRRFIVHMTRTGIDNDVCSPRLIVVDDLPHEWLFERVAGVVHHGGAGTVGATLRAGLPSLTIPRFFDQPFWAHRLQALGVSPQPIPFRQLSRERLVGGVLALDDPHLRKRAASLGTLIRGEDGVGEAVRAIERTLSVAAVRRSALQV